MENKQIKCYCGHTTYCDCSPLEEPKCTCKEHDPYCCQIHGSCPTCVKKEEPKQERMYSEEEVDNLCELIKQNERQWDLFDKNIIKIKPKSYYEIIEQFKKK